MCVCFVFNNNYYYIYYLFSITWVCYFVMYEFVFSEPEIILYYKCDVGMNHDINVLCYV